MSVAVDVSRTENEAPAELKRVPPQRVLPESRRLRPLSRHSIVGPENVKQVSGSQPRRFVRPPLLIDQEGEIDARVFAENRRITRVAKTDRRQVGALALELRLMVAQLRNVLPAKYSTVVAQENHHRGRRRPQITQEDPSAVRIRQRYIGKRLAERGRHK